MSPKDELSAALIAGIAVESERLEQQAERLVDELHLRAEKLQGLLDNFRGLFVALAATLVLLLVVVAGLVVVGLMNRANGNAIRDCTTPGGKCYERSAAQQSGIITNLLVRGCMGQHPNNEAAAAECAAAATKGN